MKKLIKSILMAAIIPFISTASFAGNGNGNKAHGCPPGLAKRNPPCIPPGLARLHRGDNLRGHNYDRIRDYDRYGLDRRHSYYRVGELIYRADPDTFLILEVIGLIDDVLN